MPLFDLIELPFCKVVRVENWNASPHRYFIAYHADGEFRHVMGLPVIDEFATFSSPIFFAPSPILGKIYNAGITLAHKRGSDLDIDAGWPPLCVGMNQTAAELPSNWEDQLLLEIQSGGGSPVPAPIMAAGFNILKMVIDQATLFATDAPLLPGQLRRICRLAETPFAIAFSTGNRLTSQQGGKTNEVHAVSEAVLREIQSRLAAHR